MLGLFAELNELQASWRVFPTRPGVAEEMQVRYRAALADPGARLLVAADGGQLVGMALGQIHRPSSYSDELAVELSSVIVHALYRGRGVGAALTAAIGRFARERGIERVTLKTFARNEEALRFWESLGFEARIVQMTARSDLL